MRKTLGLFTLWCAIIFSVGTNISQAERLKAFGLKLAWEKDLEDVSFYALSGHTPGAHPAFSPDGKYLALGTFKGHLFLFEAGTGKLIWQKRIPEGMVKRVAFSPDSQVLYYGTQSPEGEVCAVKTASGEKLWCFRTARELERGEPPPPGDIYGIYRLPGIYRLIVLPCEDLIVLAIHSWPDAKKQKWRRLSRIYRLSPYGQVRWAYPKEGPAPLSLIYADTDEQGQKVALVSLMPSEGDDLKLAPPPQSFILLDGLKGQELMVYQLTPLKPYFKRVSAWESVAVSPDGRYGALGVSDGRLFIFDLRDRQIKTCLSLATPILIGKLPVSATLSYGIFDKNGVFYIISGESTLPFGLPLEVDKPAGPHPAARTVFAIDPEKGKILWRFASPFKLQGVAVDRTAKTLAVAVAAFRREDTRVRQFGVLTFDLKSPGGGYKKLSGYFPTSGNVFFHLAVSPDGNLVAIVESPWADQYGRLFGQHRLLVLQKVSESKKLAVRADSYQNKFVGGQK
ncbi:hypothetical protein Thein_2000 [Thermodesulfatator indicus DSM 15286]|uniref:Pyrrolo-quinoline quinone repeat domain-containing protein n=1 Tax=Thermodesulfatator indicus (strain DSM 15286 / JCM 11887 / CIR29812) TaxID=667014 RepID=F8ACY7_THEID|nr:WD40 repeat domain-containing protein [Thermodesulfatator indicus]AEH45853.1 hypothetical protein Thein_2000 [Thermodesulfatator indicus DSM 15286]